VKIEVLTDVNKTRSAEYVKVYEGMTPQWFAHIIASTDSKFYLCHIALGSIEVCTCRVDYRMASELESSNRIGISSVY